jgi:tetrahydromethanopterin S-methyltransferase subunit G
MPSPRDYGDIVQLIQSAIVPLVSKVESKVDKLDEKVDRIAQEHASRADLEALRRDIQTTYVPRDAYEPRHAALIARDSQLEAALKQVEMSSQAEFQRLHERLESGKQQFEDRFREQKEAQEKQLKEQQNASLSDQDRRWVRGSQIFSFVAVLMALLDFIFQHVHIQ